MYISRKHEDVVLFAGYEPYIRYCGRLYNYKVLILGKHLRKWQSKHRHTHKYILSEKRLISAPEKKNDDCVPNTKLKKQFLSLATASLRTQHSNKNSLKPTMCWETTVIGRESLMRLRSIIVVEGIGIKTYRACINAYTHIQIRCAYMSCILMYICVCNPRRNTYAYTYINVETINFIWCN